MAGHAADRFERKRVVQLCQLAEAATALFLAVSTFAGWLTEAQIFIATFVIGIAGAFESPATAAPLPLIAPGLGAAGDRDLSGAAQVATITGPALGGLAYVFAPSLPYFVIVVFWLAGAVLTGLITSRSRNFEEGCDADDMFAGRPLHPQQPGDPRHHLARSVRRAARRRDGAVADLCARHSETGPLGLGILRAAPAVGALLMTMVLARHSINRHVGLRMFQAVIVFGAATVVFALSQWMWLSVLALAVLGAADTISVVIRFSLVQLSTPDEMRGRVGAVNFLFINASTSSASSRVASPRRCSAPCRPRCSAASGRSRSRCCG